MKQLKEMPEEKISARYRYWVTPPESLVLRVADIEASIPKENWKAGGPSDATFHLPAATIFGRNVPRISLRQLAEILPDHVLSSEGSIKLPVARLAAAYHLVEQREELPPEPAPPSTAPEPEENLSGPAPLEIVPPPDEMSVDPAPIEESGPSAPVPAQVPETAAPAADPKPLAASIPPGKIPARRTGPFAGLPIFRKKTVSTGLVLESAILEPPDAPSSVISGIRLPKRPTPEVPAGPPIPEPAAQAQEPEANPSGPAVKDPFAELPEPVLPEPPAAPVEAPPPPEVPLLKKMEPDPEAATLVKMLYSETMPREAHSSEITEQEPLQALFLTDEIMSVDRVIELCGGLPGINSCVLAHGSVVVASHNVPTGVDLVSMSAHAAEMLQAMRESSARMGVGTVPAVTLHTEKGVISFFHRDDLTMLVFHRDRGFVPGVREKMAAVLGELTKARLTLPAGGDVTD